MDILLQKIGTKPIENPIVISKPKPISKPTTIKTEVVKVKSEPIYLTAYFDFDKYDIKQIEEEKLKIFIVRLQSIPYATTIELKAYCDFKGTYDYNIELSNKRALAIYEYLIENGVPRDRINYIGLGEINDDSPRWMNRRVDIKVY